MFWRPRGGYKILSDREMDYMVRDSKGNYSDRWTYCQKPGQTDKSLCIPANIHKGVPYNVVAEPVRIGTMPSPDGILRGGQAMRIYSTEGKAVTLKGQGGGSGAKTGLYAEQVPPECFRVREATKLGYVDIPEGGVRRHEYAEQ